MPTSKTTNKKKSGNSRTSLSKNLGAPASPTKLSTSRKSGSSTRPSATVAVRQQQQQQERRSLKGPPTAHREEYADDVSEVSNEDHMDVAYGGASVDDEPQFKYSTAELAESSTRNTTCCIIAACVICLALAIGLSVMAVKLTNNNDEEKAPAPTSPTAAPGSGGSTAGQGKLTATLNEVNFDCSAPGSETCIATCTDFIDCCDPTMNSQAGCFFGNRLGCLTHARCHAIESGIDPPGPTLEALCSRSQITSDPSPCEAACNQVECCWGGAGDESTAASCALKSFYACIDYLPCQNLRGEALTVPPPIPGLKETCSSQMGTMSQVEQCDIACAAAKCCWETGVNNCLQDNFFTCLAYEPCGMLTLPEAFSTVQKPDEDLSTICSGPLKDDAKCEATCSVAGCCNGFPSCFEQDPLGCLAYEPCISL